MEGDIEYRQSVEPVPFELLNAQERPSNAKQEIQDEVLEAKYAVEAPNGTHAHDQAAADLQDRLPSLIKPDEDAATNPAETVAQEAALPAPDVVASGPELPSDEILISKLRSVLATVNLSETTGAHHKLWFCSNGLLFVSFADASVLAAIFFIAEKMLRRQLETVFGVDLSSKKALIRGEVEAYLQAQAVEGEDEAGEDSEEEEKASSCRKRSRGGASRFGEMLSEAMSKFLGLERCPRTQVVKKLWEYIREHDLQDPKDRRRILLDDKMKTIFPGKSVTMFTMQKHLSKHVYTADASEEEEESEEEGSGDDEDAPPATKKKKAAAPPARKAAPKPKSTSKSRGGGGTPKPNGFTKPVKLAPDLAAWMGSETASRPDITKKLWTYVKENNLQDPANKKFIVADATLRQLTGEERFLAFGFSKLIKDKVLGYAD